MIQALPRYTKTGAERFDAGELPRDTALYSTPRYFLPSSVSFFTNFSAAELMQ
jgi:hypothetical protein